MAHVRAQPADDITFVEASVFRIILIVRKRGRTCRTLSLNISPKLGPGVIPTDVEPIQNAVTALKLNGVIGAAQAIVAVLNHSLINRSTGRVDHFAGLERSSH